MLHEIKIKVLEKGLGFVPTSNIIKEEDLRRYFGEFIRIKGCKWYSKGEPSPDFSEVPAFRPKSTWNLPPGHHCFLVNWKVSCFSFWLVNLKLTTSLKGNG